MQLALFEPDIPQNTGTLLRLGACLDIDIHLIEPAGFLLTDKAFRRAGLDYADRATLVRHASFEAFCRDRPAGRLVLLTTKSRVSYVSWRFDPSDILLLGSESEGVPDDVRRQADAAITIPLANGARSLNVAVAGALVLGEALRQTDGFAIP